VSAETGTVIEVRPGFAMVMLKRNETCARCHGCFESKNKEYMISEVRDTYGVSIGNVVRIETSGVSKVKGGFILYILPILLLVAGYFAGSESARALGIESAAEIFGIFTSFLFFSLPFVVSYLRNRIKSKSVLPLMTIIEIVQRDRREKDEIQMNRSIHSGSL
jgi:sigma-E factor negative regulatory protein RseC